MDIGSIFLILALLIPVTLFIIRPVIEQNLAPAIHSGQVLSYLLAERDHIVATIQELDDDFKLGKIPAEDYPPQRQMLLQNGADILKQIDDLQASAGKRAVDDRLEAAILAHRQSLVANQSPTLRNGNAVPPVPDDEIEQKIASRRRSMQGKAGSFCPKCGRPVHGADQFCPRCGAALT